MQVDARGVPLSIVVTGANRHDVTQLARLLEARIVEPERDRGEEGGTVVEQNLCADAGYVGKAAEETIRSNGFRPHVRSRGEEKTAKARTPGYRARRWVVEASHSWFNRFRKLLVRFEKTEASFLALHHLAAAIIAFRQVIVVYG